MDWDRLRIFHAVAEAKSISLAAERLGMSQPAISRNIFALEKDLGCKLFSRHSRGLVLSEQAELLYRETAHIFADLDTCITQLKQMNTEPSGLLRIATTQTFGTFWLAPRMHLFMNAYPLIQVSHINSDREVNLATREADLSIRPHQSTHMLIVQRHLVTFTRSIYAAKDYLAKYGEPHKAEELDHHKLIIFGFDATNPLDNMNMLLYVGQTKNRRIPYLSVNSTHAILYALENGVGIGIMSDYIAARSPNLVKILPDIRVPSIDYYLLFREEMRQSKKIGAFRDFLLDNISP